MADYLKAKLEAKASKNIKKKKQKRVIRFIKKIRFFTSFSKARDQTFICHDQRKIYYFTFFEKKKTCFFCNRFPD